MPSYSSYTGIVSTTTLPTPGPAQPLEAAHLFILRPDIVFHARVNMATTVAVVDAITFDTVTLGAYTDISPGQTVLFGSAPGKDDYGRQRVRKAPTADTLYIGRSSTGTHDGEVTVVEDAYITVLDDFRMWAKIPYIREISDVEVEILKDSDIEVGDFTINPPPVANTGPGFAGTIDLDTGLITVTFPVPGVNSFAIADGATITTYNWDIADGTLVSGTLSDAIITVTFSAGFRWVHLTVTDSNGKMHSAHVPVYARDPYINADTTVQSWRIASHTVEQQGQKITLEVMSDIDMSLYPDGTLVMIWEREPSAPTDRNHMVMIGWLSTEVETLRASDTGYLRNVVLNVVDGAGKLDMIPGFPISVANDTTRITDKQPVITWSFMVNPNLLKYWHYLIQWHTTVLDLIDWILPNVGTEYTFTILSSEGESILNQLSRRAKVPAPNYVLTFNRAGQLGIIVDPMTQNLADRTSDVQVSITEDDWSDIRYTIQRAPRIHWLRGKAILSHPTEVNAVFANAPGLTPGQGTNPQDQSEQLVLSQEALNDVTGHQYARINAPQSEFQITLVQDDEVEATERPWRTIEPAAMTWVELSIGFEYAGQRGLYFNNARGLPKRLEIKYNYEETGTTRTVELTWERETVGVPATTYVPPPVEPLDPGFWPTPASLNTAPVITLVGDNPLLLDFGATYTDPGATATDAEDGDLTGSIVVGGDTVDTGTAGSYSVTYNVVDSLGLAAVQRTRSVVVAEEAPGPAEPDWGLRSGQSYMAIIDRNIAGGFIYRTTDFDTPASSGGPTWERVSLELLNNVYVTSFAVDPFSPGYVDGVGAINGWVAAKGGVWRITDIFGTPAASQVKPLSAISVEDAGARATRSIRASFDGTISRVIVVSQRSNSIPSGADAYFSLDGGVTWSSSNLLTSSFEASSSAIQPPAQLGLHVSSKIAGLVYSAAFTSSVTGGAPADGYVSSNNGDTWAAISNPDIQPGQGLAGMIYVPWHDNDDEKIVYHGHITQGATTQYRLKRIESDGTTITDISPNIGGKLYGVNRSNHGIHSYNANRLRLAAGVTGNDTSADKNDNLNALVVSEDGGDTWTVRLSGLTFAEAGVGLGVQFAGNDPDILFVWGKLNGAAQCVLYSTNFGVSFDDRSGNIPTDFGVDNLPMDIVTLVGGVPPA